MATYGLGCIKQKDDARDYKYLPTLEQIPQSVDLRSTGFMPAVENQGNFGSCTAFAALGAAQYAYRKSGFHNPFPPAHMYQYHFSRLTEGTPNQDSGSTIRDAIKAVNTHGTCAEHFFPYTQGNLFAAPPADAVQNASHHLASTYLAVDPTVAAIRAALAEGWPVVVGITAYAGLESQEAARTGVVPLPQPGDQPIGGHAILLCGYSDAEQRWIFRNSWGKYWALDGYGFLEYAYEVFDPWVIKLQH